MVGAQRRVGAGHVRDFLADVEIDHAIGVDARGDLQNHAGIAPVDAVHHRRAGDCTLSVACRVMIGTSSPTCSTAC